MSEWTVDTLREYIESTLAESDRRYEQRFIAQEKAILTALASAEKAIDQRREGVSAATAATIAAAGVLLGIGALLAAVIRH